MIPESLLVDLIALGSVVLIDIALAGDNAVVIGATAARLPAELRRKAIVFGIAAATLLRILFAVVAVELLAVIGLLLAGGILLLWVAWKMWRDLRAVEQEEAVAGVGTTIAVGATLGFRSAIVQITLADVSMSLDNVLAVAGTARHNIWILGFGLLLSIALMGLAATLICRLLARHVWLGYLGFAIVTFVALSMIWEGAGQIATAVAATL